MKFFLVLFFTLSLTLHATSQSVKHSQDSIKVFYDSLFFALKTEYLHKNQVNWSAIEPEIRTSLKRYTSFKNSLEQVTVLFDKIQAPHCQVFYQDTVFTATYQGPGAADFSEQWIKKYMTQPAFEAKILNNGYGYILIPGILFDNPNAETIHAIAQPMYDQIAALKTSPVKGWILDLRFNTGGHVYPILLALYDLLGDRPVWGTLDKDKKPLLKIRLNKGKYQENNKTIAAIVPTGKRLDKSKVAIITSVATSSAGEITAMAFKGRRNVRYFGENSFGFTTSNDEKSLPFGISMALTTAYDCDRNNRYYDKIIPDVKIVKQDNFDDLLMDKNIIEAINWINR